MLKEILSRVLRRFCKRKVDISSKCYAMLGDESGYLVLPADDVQLLPDGRYKCTIKGEQYTMFESALFNDWRAAVKFVTDDLRNTADALDGVVKSRKPTNGYLNLGVVRTVYGDDPQGKSILRPGISISVGVRPNRKEQQ